MNVYLYGVIKRPDEPRSLELGCGVSDPAAPVRLLGYRDLAAAVSQVNEQEIGEAGGVRALRRDVNSHTQVLNRLMDQTTVLPARFGILLPDEQTLVDKLLEPTYERLLEDLERLRGTVELTFRADYVEERILEEVATEQPQLIGAGRRSIQNTYHARIETGRRIASAIRLKKEQDAQRLLERLGRIAHDVAVADSRSELSVFRGSFLIRREDLERFDRELERVNAEAGSRMKLACVGPLPPFSFVHLQVGTG
ncbi:MAG TPA: GvpL/GvpF family gas vesicle protein [Tepidisphaeraceae bacterium]|nr:GvpL/GvpF family gas vesicle protein [Tepidisphaeraceae bacterium]